MKERDSRQGFSVIEVLIAIGVTVTLCVTGWYAIGRIRSNPPTDAHQSSTRRQTLLTPAGYKTYTNTQYGFAFAYPNQWGDLERWTNPLVGGYTAASAESNVYRISDVSVARGRLAFTAYQKDRFNLVAQKYGASVKSTKIDGNIHWEVTDPGDDPNYAVGDEYPVLSFINASGVTVYDFTWIDEGATYGRWVFETDDYFIELELPHLVTFDDEDGNGRETSLTDIMSYEMLRKDIAKTIRRD